MESLSLEYIQSLYQSTVSIENGNNDLWDSLSEQLPQPDATALDYSNFYLAFLQKDLKTAIYYLSKMMGGLQDQNTSLQCILNLLEVMPILPGMDTPAWSMCTQSMNGFWDSIKGNLGQYTAFAYIDKNLPNLNIGEYDDNRDAINNCETSIEQIMAA